MKNRYLILLLLSMYFFSCESVDIENFDNPDFSVIQSNPDDYPNYLNGAYYAWWDGLHKDNPYMTLSVASNHGTASWGNFNMQNVGTVTSPYGLGDHSSLNNTQTAAYTAYLEDPWYKLNNAISTANSVLKGIRINKLKVQGDDNLTNQTLAQALFVRGISYGYLGLLFDRAFIATEDINIDKAIFDESTLKLYTEVINQGIKDIEEALAIANSLPSFKITQFNGLVLNKEQSIALGNTFIAKFIALSPRTPEENNTIDWEKVKTHAKKGINYDFAPIGDGGTNWWHAYIRQTNHIWMRLDQQIVNMVDSSQPYPFPKSGSYSLPTTFPDNRFGDSGSGKWFTLSGSPIFRPNRGVYFFSYFKFEKYNAYRLDQTLPMVSITNEDNNLMLAEAIIRTGGDLSQAASIINETRVTNGGLSPATSSDSDLLDKLFYERYLEAYESPGNPFFDRRRNGTLGKKQFRQFPIPAKELNTIRMPLYTFGGE